MLESVGMLLIKSTAREKWPFGMKLKTALDELGDEEVNSFGKMRESHKNDKKMSFIHMGLIAFMGVKCACSTFYRNGLTSCREGHIYGPRRRVP